jgi:hypothetical protein
LRRQAWPGATSRRPENSPYYCRRRTLRDPSISAEPAAQFAITNGASECDRHRDTKCETALDIVKMLHRRR